MKLNRYPCALMVVALLLTLVHTASASMILGDYVGTFSGNDKLANVQINAGSDPTLVFLGKVDLPDSVTVGQELTTDGLTLTVTQVDDEGGLLAGVWSFNGVGSVQYTAVKASNAYSLFDFGESTMPNAGLFENTYITNKRGKPHAISHVSLYGLASAPPVNIPEPTTAALVGCGAAMLLRRRR